MRFQRLWLLAATLVLSGVTTGLAYEGLHGNRESAPKTNYDSLYTAAISVDQSPEAKQLLADCLEAYGGVSHLEQLHSLTLNYEMIERLSREATEVTKHWATGRLYKTTKQGTTGFFKQRVLNKAKSWRVVRDSVASVEGEGYNSQLFSYLVLSMPLAITTEPFSGVKYGRRDADSLAYIYMKKDDSLMVIVGINPENKMIESAEGVIYNATGASVYINNFSDFKKIDGYLLPHKIVYTSLGMEVGRSMLESAVINPETTDETFLIDDNLRRMD